MGDPACWMVIEDDVVARRAGAGDVPGLLELRRALWPDDDIDAPGLEAFLGRADVAVILAVAPDGKLAGFAEVGTRPYAEGCTSSPVAFLEGWYVEPEHRRRGVGRLLVVHVESWARARGFTELGSDTWLENHASQKAHVALGFEEVERTVAFRKEL